MNKDSTKMRQTLYRYPHLIGMMVAGGFAGILQLYVILDCVFPLIAYEVDAVSSAAPKSTTKSTSTKSTSTKNSKAIANAIKKLVNKK